MFRVLNFIVKHFIKFANLKSSAVVKMCTIIQIVQSVVVMAVPNVIATTSVNWHSKRDVNKNVSMFSH